MGNVKTPEALAREVRARRLAMGIPTVKKLAQLAGFTVKTGSSIENAKQTAYRPQTMNQLDRALLWEPGTAQSILDGEDPEIEPYDPGPDVAGGSGSSGAESPSSLAPVVALPASAVEGLSEAELDEVESVAKAAALQRAREIQAARREAEVIPDFSQLAARTVRRRSQWEAAKSGGDAGEEPQG